MIEPVGARDGDLAVTLIVEQLRRSVPGGIGTYIEGLVRALVASTDPTAGSFTLFASRSRTNDDPLANLGAKTRTTRVPGPILTRLWELGTGPRVARTGMVHALSLAVPPTHLRLAVTVHDLAFRVVPETFTRHGRQWHERALLRAARHAEAFVVPSESVATQLVDAGLGVAADQVHVIGEGSDHLGPPDILGARQVLDEHEVHGRFILSVGTIEPRKNLSRLIDAFGRAREEFGEPCSLVICGPTGWSADLAPAKGVVLIGRVPGPVLAGLYASAQVVAYVPLVEGFGLPVVEAMRYGAVVLSSAVPSARRGAHVVDASDVDAIAAGLIRCVQDDELRARLRADGLAYTKGLTWERTAEEHLSLWTTLAGR